MSNVVKFNNKATLPTVGDMSWRTAVMTHRDKLSGYLISQGFSERIVELKLTQAEHKYERRIHNALLQIMGLKVEVAKKVPFAPDLIETLAEMKYAGVTVQKIMALAIVNENASARYPMLYVGEVESYFRMALTVETRGLWSYSAVGAMLRKLYLEGFLERERHGRAFAYGITNKGVELLSSVLGENVEYSPKKKDRRKTS